MQLIPRAASPRRDFQTLARSLLELPFRALSLCSFNGVTESARPRRRLGARATLPGVGPACARAALPRLLPPAVRAPCAGARPRGSAPERPGPRAAAGGTGDQRLREDATAFLTDSPLREDEPRWPTVVSSFPRMISRASFPSKARGWSCERYYHI